MLDLLAGGNGAQFETVARFVNQPLTILPFAAFILLFGPLPEELGWRGYALDRLQAKWNALASSLVLGTAWSLWHLPLFFIEDTYQNGLGLGTLPFRLFMMAMLPETILMTWIYNHNRRSTLSAVIFQFIDQFHRGTLHSNGTGGILSSLIAHCCRNSSYRCLWTRDIDSRAGKSRCSKEIAIE